MWTVTKEKEQKKEDRKDDDDDNDDDKRWNFDDENWRIVRIYRTIFKELRTKSWKAAHRTQSILKYYNQKTKCKIPVFRTDMVAGVKQPVESAGFIFADS